MTDMSQTSSAWAFMDPWWQTLEGHHVHAVHAAADTDDIGGLCVYLEPPRDLSLEIAEQQCRALRDALELVFLLSVVDTKAFLEGLVNHAPKRIQANLKRCLPVDADDFPCYVTILHLSLASSRHTWVRNMIWTMLKPERLDERDPAFQNARQQLLRSLDAGVVYSKLKIAIDLPHVNCALAAKVLANFIRTAPPPAADYPFRSVVLRLSSQTAFVSDKRLEDIETCVDDRHQRVDIRSTEIVADSGADEVKCGDLLSTLLLAPDSHIGERAEKVSAISIELRSCPKHHLAPQVCSALMCARGIESLTLDCLLDAFVPANDRIQLMRWITVSLFSSHARHSIRQVTLEGFFVDEDDMDDLETLFLSKNPLGVLRGDQHEEVDDVDASPSSLKQIFVAKGATLLLNLASTSPVAVNESKTAQLKRDSWADCVAGDAVDPEHCKAFVPGYGWCRVRRDDIQSHRVFNQSHSAGQLPKHGVKSLALKWYEERSRRANEEYLGLCRFLRLIGAPLDELTLSNVRDVTFILGSMSTACPLLTRLEFHEVDFDVLRAISDAYESGTCRARSLVFRRIRGQRGQQDVIDFCGKLCHPELLISRTLTELSIYVADGPTNEVLAAMVRMLECNIRLVRFSTNDSYSRLEHMRARFSPHNNQSLPGQGAPLELTRKLAFLSAVCQRGPSGETEAAIHGPRAISALDCDVIARVFEMAARPVKRKVSVTSV